MFEVHESNYLSNMIFDPLHKRVIHRCLKPIQANFVTVKAFIRSRHGQNRNSSVRFGYSSISFHAYYFAPNFIVDLLPFFQYLLNVILLLFLLLLLLLKMMMMMMMMMMMKLVMMIARVMVIILAMLVVVVMAIGANDHYKIVK